MENSSALKMFKDYLKSIGATNTNWKDNKHMLKQFIAISEGTQTEESINFQMFLESIGGLESTYRPDVKITNRYYFEIGDGWLPLVKKLIEDCIACGWNKQISQVKSKFGGLRFYIGEHSDSVSNLIKEAENKSYSICENCGDNGILRKSETGWYYTACDKCVK